MPFHVYLLECSDQSLYCGYAKDLKKRLKEHQDGKASKYTRSRLPVKLAYFEEVETRVQALKREAKIKALSRKEKLILAGKKC